jgi:hypothetical protein
VAFGESYEVQEFELGERQSAPCDFPQLLIQQVVDRRKIDLHAAQEAIDGSDRAGLLH